MAQYSIRCRGTLLTFDRPALMGILNCTPDSFWAGSRTDLSAVVERAGALLEAGALFLDLGGQSTRPGAAEVGAQEEADRVVPAVSAVHQAFPQAFISIDTYWAAVARAAVGAGACLINDVSAGTLDPEMWTAVAALQVPYVLSHIQGRPGTMQQAPKYEHVVLEVFDRLNRDFHSLRAMGVSDIILDPGFGFGKTVAHNFTLLQALPFLRRLPGPVMVGVSRKATVYKTLGTTAAEALNGTTVLHTMALNAGVQMLRVHDVREAREALVLTERAKEKGNGMLPFSPFRPESAG